MQKPNKLIAPDMPEKGFYTVGEEISHAITHGVGALCAVAATAVFIVMAVMYGDGLTLLAAMLYGISMILQFSSSTLYHAISHPGAKRVLRIFDHCTIFLLIAGTYSPFTLITLHGTVGSWLFFGIWGIAVVGITLNAISLKRFERISTALYILMGWAVVVAIKPLYLALAPAGFWMLVAGGVVYTAGVLFYVLKWKYAHFIWHLFVLTGALLHFLTILLYVMPH